MRRDPYPEAMGLLRRIRSIFGSGSEGGGRKRSSKRNAKRMAKASEALSEMRGERVSPQSADHGTTSMENIAAAAKDYGLSRFSGETDAMSGAAKSYRPAKSRRQRKREGS